MQVLVTTLVAVLVALGAPRTASAKTSLDTPIFVLESHVGARSAEIGRVMDTLRDLLEPYGFAARPAAIQRLAGQAMPRPGVLDPELTEASIAQHLRDGWAAFAAAQWEEASTKLTRALDEVHRNPALVVSDIGNLDHVFKAYVALAVTQRRLADVRGAARTMTEMIRVFPARAVARDEAWGRDGERLYSDVATRVREMARGRLSIVSGHPEAAIFVDGQLRGTGTAELADLVPGTYRVFLRPPGSIGRQYEVLVAANDDSYLDVDLNLDMSVWATDAWIGLQLANEEARAYEDKYALEVARRWMGQGTLAVLATGQYKGRPILVGARYRDGIELRRARIYLDDAGGPRALARFLVDGATGPGLEVLATAATAMPRERRRSWSPIPQIVLATGVLATAGSLAWYIAAPEDDHKVPRYTDWKLPAALACASSSMVMGAGLYLYLRESTSMEHLTAAALGLGVGALTAAPLLLIADRDAVTRPGVHVRERYRNTAPMGLFFGGTGLVLLGVAAWQIGREYGEGGAPIVAVERGGGVIGWSGRL